MILKLIVRNLFPLIETINLFIYIHIYIYIVYRGKRIIDR